MSTDQIIQAGLARCERIIAGVDELRPFLEPILPVQNDDLDRLEVVQRIACVALLKRFEQLQDMVGRVSRAVLDWEAEDVRAMTRRDLANWMERLCIIDDADRWIDLSDLRNRLVHEYPIEEREQVDRTNEKWAVVSELIEMVRRIEDHLKRAGFSQ